jgi:hypothetical protein
MMYLLSICFNQIDVFKPATSKEGNSEVYIVCRDFKRVPWVVDYLAGVKVTLLYEPYQKMYFLLSCLAIHIKNSRKANLSPLLRTFP